VVNDSNPERTVVWIDRGVTGLEMFVVGPRAGIHTLIDAEQKSIDHDEVFVH
jgi:hypothetical protein